jgi:hypothetical protein
MPADSAETNQPTVAAPFGGKRCLVRRPRSKPISLQKLNAAAKEPSNRAGKPAIPVMGAFTSLLHLHYIEGISCQSRKFRHAPQAVLFIASLQPEATASENLFLRGATLMTGGLFHGW